MARKRQQILRFENLGGMDEGYRTDPTSAHKIVNMRLDPLGAWREAGGFIAARDGLDALGAVHSIHWFSQHNGNRQWLLLEHENGLDLDLRYIDFGAAVGDASVVISSGRKRVDGPWQGTTYFNDANWVYILNGYDQPIRWDGRELVPVGFSVPPPAPTVSEAGFDLAAADFNGLGGLAVLVNAFQRGIGEADVIADQPWVYGWAVTWINDRGMESPPSETIFLTGENPKVVIVDPAIDPDANANGLRSAFLQISEAPDNVRGIRLYRTANIFGITTVGQQGAALYFHSEYGSGGEIFVIDDVPDRELGLQLSPNNSGLFPRSARYAAKFKGTLFVDGGSESPDQIRFSSPGLIEQMPSLNYLIVGSSKAGPITGLYATRNALVVFRRGGIYFVKGDPINGFFSETFTEDTGLAAPRSLAEAPGQGLLFLSDEGPYVLIGALENTGTPTNLVYLGKPIRETWDRRVNGLSLMAARASVYHRDREIWIEVPADGDDRPKLGLVYHYEQGVWSLRENYPIACMVEARDHRGHLFFGSREAARQNIWVYTPGAGQLDVDIIAEYQTAWMSFPSRSHIQVFQPFLVGYGRAITVEWRADWGTPFNPTDDTQLLSGNAEKPREVWDTALWDADAIWEDYTPARLRYHFDGSNVFELNVSIRSERLRIVEFELFPPIGAAAADVRQEKV